MDGFQVRSTPDPRDEFFDPKKASPVQLFGVRISLPRVHTPLAASKVHYRAEENNPFQAANESGKDIGNQDDYSPAMRELLAKTSRDPYKFLHNPDFI